jgi:copper homeostasis protein
MHRLCDDRGVPEPILEVIALDAADAVAAQAGGADRIELVSGMRHGGLTPTVETYERVRAVTDLPVRVMLRSTPGYAYSPGPAAAAAEFRAAGADEFVLGFLDPAGAVDRAAVENVLTALGGCRWTFHRALDHAADRAAARAALAGLPGLDFVLTAGAPTGVADGLAVLAAEARSEPRILAGGGLHPGHVAPLAASGVDAFHIGTGARPDGRWDRPADAGRIREWRARLDRVSVP